MSRSRRSARAALPWQALTAAAAAFLLVGLNATAAHAEPAHDNGLSVAIRSLMSWYRSSRSFRSALSTTATNSGGVAGATIESD